MKRITHTSWILGGIALLLVGCSPLKPGPDGGLSFDDSTQRYGVHVAGATRGELLDELQRLYQVDVRPQPARDDKLTLDAEGLDLDQLLARLMPAGTHYIARRGDREVSSHVPATGQRKEGGKLDVKPGLPAKDETRADLRRDGSLKPAVNFTRPDQPVEIAGPMLKAPADKLLMAANYEPKSPRAMRIPRSSVRVTLAFEEGATPRVIAVQSIEGGAPVERFVRGPFLFALVDADGRPIQYGSFQDPLEEHSYLPEGPHSIGRAKSGIAGISLDRSKIDSARLLVIDARGLALPRELDDEVILGAMKRAKVLLEMPTAELLRALEQEQAK